MVLNEVRSPTFVLLGRRSAAVPQRGRDRAALGTAEISVAVSACELGNLDSVNQPDTLPHLLGLGQASRPTVRPRWGCERPPAFAGGQSPD